MKRQGLSRRRATDVTLPEDLVAKARSLGVSLSKSCENGLTEAVRHAERVRWKIDNADWIAAHRRWIEENQLPLERYRLF